MAASTRIEWTDVTWNPVTGCRKVSRGCENCYAATLAKRLKAMGSPRYQADGPDGPGFGVTLHHDKVAEPTRWKRPSRIFVNSMSDMFHSSVDEAFIKSMYETMCEASQHQFQILTKRPKRMAHVVAAVVGQLGVVPSNVWLGTSVEDQEYCWRIDWLKRTPARVRFLSIEPLIGPITQLDLDGIDWVIVGGESGHRCRPIEIHWVRSIRDACLKHSVPFFFKQWGGRTPKSGGRLLDGRTWEQYPEQTPRKNVPL